jgi:hypothetical protein
MHSIKNISEINKIDTQSRSVTKIRRKRLIRKSDYNLKCGCIKVFVKLKKTLKTLSSGQKTQKNPLGWVFYKGSFADPKLYCTNFSTGSVMIIPIG